MFVMARYAQVLRSYFPSSPKTEENLYLLRMSALAAAKETGQVQHLTVAVVGGCHARIVDHLARLCRALPAGTLQ
jgi:hypothetical protein